MTGNLCWFIDSNLLAGHTWRGSPVAGFDPEGILSTIPAIGTALMGVLTGHLLRSKLSREEKTAWMFVAGNFLLLLGAILDMWFPINKGLWTSSYVIFMAGWANVCLAMFYWLIDVKGYKTWSTPFVIYGMNAITVFVLSGLIAKSMGLIRWVAEDGQKMSPLVVHLSDRVRAAGQPDEFVAPLCHLVHLHDVPGGLVHVEEAVVPEGLTEHRESEQ